MQEYISNFIFPGRIRRIINYLCLLLLIGLLTMCQKEEYATKDYPRLNTLEVSITSESSAVFTAEIVSGNLADIIEHGFVWDTNFYPETDLINRQFITGEINPDNKNKFSVNILTSFTKGKIYYMRSYVKTDNIMVYGKIVSFSF